MIANAAAREPDLDTSKLDPAYVERTHSGKRSYASKADAKHVARLVTPKFGGVKKIAYRCAVCGGWHVGADVRVTVRRRYRNVTQDGE